MRNSPYISTAITSSLTRSIKESFLTLPLEIKPGEQKGEGKGVFCRGFGGSRGGCTKAGERFWPPSLIFDDVMISDGALTGSTPVVMMIIILVLICLLRMMKNDNNDGLAGSALCLRF